MVFRVFLLNGFGISSTIPAFPVLFLMVSERYPRFPPVCRKDLSSESALARVEGKNVAIRLGSDIWKYLETIWLVKLKVRRDKDWPASQKVRKLSPGYRHELRNGNLQLIHRMLTRAAMPLFGKFKFSVRRWGTRWINLRDGLQSRMIMGWQSHVFITPRRHGYEIQSLFHHLLPQYIISHLPPLSKG